MDKRDKKLLIWTFLVYLAVVVLTYIDRRMANILDFLGIHDFKILEFYMDHVSDIINVYLIMGIFQIVLPLYIAYRYGIRLHEKTEASKVVFGIVLGVVLVFMILLCFDTSFIAANGTAVTYGVKGNMLFNYILDMIIMSISMFLLYIFIIPRAVERGFADAARGRRFAVLLSALSYPILMSLGGLRFSGFVFATIMFLLISGCSVSSRSIYVTLPLIFAFNVVRYSSHFYGYSRYVSQQGIFPKLAIAVVSLCVFIFFSMRKRKAEKATGENIDLSV